MDFWLSGNGHIACKRVEDMDFWVAGERELPNGHFRLNTIDFVEKRLLSYFYHGKNNVPSRQILEHHRRGIRIFLDSGAFSAFTQEKPLDLIEYTDFCLENRHLFEHIAALDVIGDHDASWENYQYMKEQGVHDVIPTFHHGEPFDFLQAMANEADYIAIGGVAQLGKGGSDKVRAFFDQCWGDYLVDADGKPTTKVHGFAVTAVGLVSQYPWESVDSSSWVMGSAMGKVKFIFPKTNTSVDVIFSEENPEAKKVKGKFYGNMTGMERLQVDRWLEETGITAEECKTYYGARDIANVINFKKLEQCAPATFFQPQQGLF